MSALVIQLDAPQGRVQTLQHPIKNVQKPSQLRAVPHSQIALQWDGQTVTGKPLRSGQQLSLKKAGTDLWIELDGEVAIEVLDFYAQEDTQLVGSDWSFDAGQGLTQTGQAVVASPQTLATHLDTATVFSTARELTGTSVLMLGMAAVAHSSKDNAAPTPNTTAPLSLAFATGSSSSVNVAENTASTTVFYTASATGHAGNLTYSFDQGDDDALFNLDASTGALSFKTAPDFEAPASAAGSNTYIVKIKVNDASGHSTVQTLTVQVTDVDEVAPVFNAGAAAHASVAENTTTVAYTAAATDNVAVSQYSFDGGADDALFDLNATTGALTFKKHPNYEAPASAAGTNTYTVKVKAVDAEGNFAVQTLTLDVTNVNDEINLSAVAAGSGGFVINGQGIGDSSGYSVSSAGDVNGDGLADLIVGAYQSDPTTGANAGRSYVVFGKANSTAVDLSAVAAGTGGFVINGQGAGDQSGFSVSSAGDVNGDGLADLIVGANQAAPAAGSSAGRSYVVFGKADSTAVDLSAVAAGTGGFVINGQGAGDRSGYSVSSAGDVNGDGLADLIVGAPFADSPDGNQYIGRSYVVFGQSGNAAVDLNAIAAGASGGFAIFGQTDLPPSGSLDGRSGGSVSGAGDLNGDGLADLIVGARFYTWSTTGMTHGRSYVVFGKASATAIHLSDLDAGQGGFFINGQSTRDNSGASVASAGDVNGDGLTDLIVGAMGYFGVTGRSYVIFGSTTDAFLPETRVDVMGTTGDDVLTDSNVAKTLIGDQGNDILSADAASVLYGGAGDDTFSIGAGMLTALQSLLGAGGNLDRLARMDGGSGIDTVALNGSGLSLDLTLIANIAAGQTDGGSRIDSVEHIDLTGTGNNTLKLKASDVLDMTGFNLYEPTGRHQLWVTGDNGDTLDLLDGAGTTGWTQTSTTAINGVLCDVWNHNTTLATLYVQQTVGVI